MAEIKPPKWCTIELLNRMLDAAESNPSRQKYLANAKSCFRWYKGERGIVPIDGFDDMTVSDRQAARRINKIKQVTNKVNSIFMKNDPTVRRYAELEDDADLADHMDAMFQSEWVDTNGQITMRSMLNEATITGLSVGKVYWNPLNTERHKDGSIAVSKLSPGSVYLDPSATNMHRGRDCGYIIHKSVKPLWWTLSRYKEDAEVAIGLRDGRGRRKDGNVITNLGKDVKDYVKGKFMGDGGLKDEVEIYEYWIFPHVMLAGRLVGGYDPSIDEHPYGIVVTKINDTIVRCITNPFVGTKKIESLNEFGIRTTQRKEIGHKRHPFYLLYWSREVDYEGEGEYGIYDCSGAVENAISVQFNINSLRRMIGINAQTLANPSVIINEDAFENPPDTLTWTPGQILLIRNNYSPDMALKILEGKAMPDQVTQILQDDYSEIEKTFGLEPGVVGLFPQGGGTSHTPGVTVGALQEAAFGPLWTYVAELGVAFLDASILYDGLIQQKFSEDRYTTVSRTGQQRSIEWTDRHITANFKRQVVSGASTVLYDIDKLNRLTTYASVANQAIMSQNPATMEVAIAHLTALGDPNVFEFVGIIKKEMAKILNAQAQLQQIGESQLASQEQQAGGIPREIDFDEIEMALSQ